MELSFFEFRLGKDIDYGGYGRLKKIKKAINVFLKRAQCAAYLTKHSL
jgi:hypothetical protein